MTEINNIMHQNDLNQSLVVPTSIFHNNKNSLDQ
jgi:hypothetical protein